MASLDHRGHEVLSDKVMEVPLYKSRLGKTRRMTVFDHQRLAIQRLRMDQEAQIQNKEDLHKELYDFTMPASSDADMLNGQLPTSEVPDWVPDEYIAPEVEAPENLSVESESTALQDPAGKAE